MSKNTPSKAGIENQRDMLRAIFGLGGELNAASEQMELDLRKNFIRSLFDGKPRLSFRGLNVHA